MNSHSDFIPGKSYTHAAFRRACLCIGHSSSGRAVLERSDDDGGMDFFAVVDPAAWIEARQPLEIWMVIRPNGIRHLFNTEEKARAYARGVGGEVHHLKEILYD